MKKVGLITLYINNFGSLLQAYATRTFLLKNGYDPVSIQKEAGIIEAYEIEANRKKHPDFMEDFQTFMASVTNNNSLVPEESVRQILLCQVVSLPSSLTAIVINAGSWFWSHKRRICLARGAMSFAYMDVLLLLRPAACGQYAS